MKTATIKIQGVNNYAIVTYFNITDDLQAFYAACGNCSMQGTCTLTGKVYVYNNTFNSVSTEIIINDLPHVI